MRMGEARTDRWYQVRFLEVTFLLGVIIKPRSWGGEGREGEEQGFQEKN